MNNQDLSDLIRFTPNLVLVGGPSGVGKTKIIDTLIRLNKDFARPISYTSRTKRDHELTGEYIFVDRNEILRMRVPDEVLTIDKIYGNLYAMSCKSIYEILESNKIPIKEVHPVNHGKLRKFFPDLISVLILPYPERSDQSPIGTDISLRAERKPKDEKYYSKINPQQFDIVLRTTSSIAVESLAESLKISILSLTSTSHYFPRPQSIDEINRLGYTKVASEFSDDRRITTKNFHDLSYSFFLDVLNNNIKPGMKCLEVGPGQGWLRKNFSWPKVDYIGVDISAEMLKYGESEYSTHSSIRTLNYPDGHFDIVLASLADPYCHPAALCEVRRVLKKQGYFILSSPSCIWAEGIRGKSDKNKTHFILDDNTSIEVFSFTFSIEALLRLLSLCGLEPTSHQVAYGRNLPTNTIISPAIIKSADSLGVNILDLPILNLIKARRRS